MSDEERELDEYIEENLDETVEEEAEPEGEALIEETEEPSEEEAEAKKYGHLSKEDWEAQGKDPKLYKTPEEFNKTAKVIDQLYTLKKKVDQRDREIQALVDYQKRTSQREYDRAKQDLEGRLEASKYDLDMEGVAHYTKELTRLQDREEQSQAHESQNSQKAAQEAFIDRNQHWFNDRNPDLKSRAIEIDNELKSIYPNATYEELAEKIEKRMQYDYPERVLGVSRARPNVSSRSSSVNKTDAGKPSVSKAFQGLSQDLKDTYTATKRIVESRGGAEYSMNDFIAQLKKDGEL